MAKEQTVPPMRELNEPVDDGRTTFVLAEGYDVFSWLPGPPGSGPATQVHLMMSIPGVANAKMVLRLKSARALDELVGVLLQHRADVWPK